MPPPSRDRPAALVRLAAAAAGRDRLQGWQPDPATTARQRRDAHRRECRAAGAALRDAVADAYRAGISIEVVARVAGFSPGNVRMVLHRARTAPEPSPFRIPGELVSTPPPWSVGEHLWRRLDHGLHHLGTITRVWHDGDRWMVEYDYGALADKTTTAPAAEMYRAGPMTRPV
ncbi:hypothetical protein [Embleya scabrispora]|uniref:hypothetical protein n=1 Tax=Embleya scabrispora TaxID=159449 RepID=UPI00117DF340|nr:hypothetical protein [Embleya scabrispora]